MGGFYLFSCKMHLTLSSEKFSDVAPGTALTAHQTQPVKGNEGTHSKPE